MQPIVIYTGPDACQGCLGWKRIANSDDGEPWKFWAELTPPENLAVTLGLVYPIICPRCGGSGREPEADPARPIIVCLCGSTRFWRTFQEAGLRETLAGRIVLSIGAASGTDDAHFGNLRKAEYDRVKAMLDELHLRKIDLADEVLILNVGGYVGESTARELTYAQAHGKRVRWLEEPTNE